MILIRCYYLVSCLDAHASDSHNIRTPKLGDPTFLVCLHWITATINLHPICEMSYIEAYYIKGWVYTRPEKHLLLNFNYYMTVLSLRFEELTTVTIQIPYLSVFWIVKTCLIVEWSFKIRTNISSFWMEVVRWSYLKCKEPFYHS